MVVVHSSPDDPGLSFCSSSVARTILNSSSEVYMIKWKQKKLRNWTFFFRVSCRIEWKKRERDPTQMVYLCFYGMDICRQRFEDCGYMKMEIIVSNRIQRLWFAWKKEIKFLVRKHIVPQYHVFFFNFNFGFRHFDRLIYGVWTLHHTNSNRVNPSFFRRLVWPHQSCCLHMANWTWRVTYYSDFNHKPFATKSPSNMFLFDFCPCVFSYT